MKYAPSECPKCGSALVKSSKGGRPTRWCCEGCKRSGEGKYVDQLNARPDKRRDEALAEMQARYDHLAGVPVRA